MRFPLYLILPLAGVGATVAQTSEDTFELDPIAANADRILADGASAETAVSTLGLHELQLDQFRDISDALSSYPGIASYRRTHPTSAHPTTQGLRLRNLGSNASSRALVLYNGVPQNDPFGGWIYWHQYDLSRVESISIHPSGVGEIWGNMASGGLLSMVASDATPGSQYFQASLGTADRIDLRAHAAYSVGDEAVLDLGLRHFDTDGFHTLDEAQRGSVDRPAHSTATSFNSRLSWKSGELWRSQLSLRGFEEKRGNGTGVAQNDTEALDLSFITERELPANGARLNINLYLQDREFQNVFASVAADRNSERPALDQYKMPAQSFGGAIVYRQEGENALNYSAGLDFRFIDGSVNERFRNLGSGFTRERYAGGEQAFIGLFAKLDAKLSDADQISVTARIEEVSREAGARIESNTETDSIIRNERYADRSRSILSGNLNWRHELSDAQSTQLALFSGYRAPTLNELYRPFRVRNDITEANPELANERHQGIEFSFNQNPSESASYRISGFYYEAEEMIANALFTTASGFDPRFGFIPSGGSGSARVNLERSTVSGIELQAKRSLSDTLTASLTAVYSKTKIREDELSELAGNAFPHSSPWKAVASLDWQASETLTLWTNYRWYDRSWENLSNTRRLGATADLSLGARYEFDSSHSLSLTLSNALDEENITGIATNGLITIDEPRELLLTYTWRK